MRILSAPVIHTRILLPDAFGSSVPDISAALCCFCASQITQNTQDRKIEIHTPFLEVISVTVLLLRNVEFLNFHIFAHSLPDNSVAQMLSVLHKQALMFVLLRILREGLLFQTLLSYFSELLLFHQE